MGSFVNTNGLCHIVTLCLAITHPFWNLLLQIILHALLCAELKASRPSFGSRVSLPTLYDHLLQLCAWSAARPIA